MGRGLVVAILGAAISAGVVLAVQARSGPVAPPRDPGWLVAASEREIGEWVRDQVVGPAVAADGLPSHASVYLVRRFTGFELAAVWPGDGAVPIECSANPFALVVLQGDILSHAARADRRFNYTLHAVDLMDGRLAWYSGGSLDDAPYTALASLRPSARTLPDSPMAMPGVAGGEGLTSRPSGYCTLPGLSPATTASWRPGHPPARRMFTESRPNEVRPPPVNLPPPRLLGPDGTPREPTVDSATVRNRLPVPVRVLARGAPANDHLLGPGASITLRWFGRSPSMGGPPTSLEERLEAVGLEGERLYCRVWTYGEVSHQNWWVEIASTSIPLDARCGDTPRPVSGLERLRLAYETYDELRVTGAVAGLSVVRSKNGTFDGTARNWNVSTHVNWESGIKRGTWSFTGHGYHVYRGRYLDPSSEPIALIPSDPFPPMLDSTDAVRLAADLGRDLKTLYSISLIQHEGETVWDLAFIGQKCGGHLRIKATTGRVLENTYPRESLPC